MSVMKALRAAGRTSCRCSGPCWGGCCHGASQDPDTLAALSGNVSRNLLGLGNAATPLGVKAASAWRRDRGRATDSCAGWVVLNTASIQLLPTTVAGVRAALGAESAF